MTEKHGYEVGDDGDCYVYTNDKCGLAGYEAFITLEKNPPAQKVAVILSLPHGEPRNPTQLQDLGQRVLLFSQDMLALQNKGYSLDPSHVYDDNVCYLHSEVSFENAQGLSKILQDYALGARK